VARQLSPHELDDLLGAFALDAVDDSEREQVEQYLRQNPRARALVAEYRETAAFLAHAGTDAPAGLWERIEERLAEQPTPWRPARRRFSCGLGAGRRYPASRWQQPRL
jgi:anti-sigma factor RsiW